jgi:hypothetical protein
MVIGILLVVGGALMWIVCGRFGSADDSSAGRGLPMARAAGA